MRRSFSIEVHKFSRLVPGLHERFVLDGKRIFIGKYPKTVNYIWQRDPSVMLAYGQHGNGYDYHQFGYKPTSNNRLLRFALNHTSGVNSEWQENRLLADIKQAKRLRRLYPNAVEIADDDLLKQFFKDIDSINANTEHVSKGKRSFSIRMRPATVLKLRNKYPQSCWAYFPIPKRTTSEDKFGEALHRAGSEYTIHVQHPIRLLNRRHVSVDFLVGPGYYDFNDPFNRYDNDSQEIVAVSDVRLLIIEYDEKQHAYNQAADAEREMQIRQALPGNKCHQLKFVRVRQDEERGFFIKQWPKLKKWLNDGDK